VKATIGLEAATVVSRFAAKAEVSIDRSATIFFSHALRLRLGQLPHLG
jgi:hypothetical protein